MTLPSAYNTITMAQVNTELGRASNAAINLNETAVRTLAGVPSGAISLHNLHGKSAVTLGFNQGGALSIYNGSEDNCAYFTLTSEGVITPGVSGTGPTAYLSPTGAGNGANYEACIYHAASTGDRPMWVGYNLYVGYSSQWKSLDNFAMFSGASERGYDVYSYGTLFIRKKDLSASISVNFTIESRRIVIPPS